MIMFYLCIISRVLVSVYISEMKSNILAVYPEVVSLIPGPSFSKFEKNKKRLMQDTPQGMDGCIRTVYPNDSN